MDSTHLQVHDLVFEYKNGEPVLNQLNMKIPRGSIYGFLGKNGAGKTTTIRNMLGLIQAKSGKVTLNGEAVNRSSNDLFRKVGSLIENPSLYGHLTGVDNLKLVCNYYSIGRERIARVLDQVGLTQAGSMKSKKYSTGMKQRLGLAMALIHEPELLILDEPIRGLDPSGIQEIRKLILEINTRGTTILLSSHILSEIEKIVSHIGVIEHGNLQFEGAYSDLIDHINHGTRLNIRSKNPAKLQQYLSEFAEAKLDGTWVSIPNQSDLDTADLVKKLVDTGHEIYEVKKEQNALESIFLGMTNTNSN